MLLPVRLFGLGRLINRFVAPLPLIRQLCLRHYTVCRSLRRSPRSVEIGDGRGSRAQRTRQHRGGGPAHSALRSTTSRSFSSRATPRTAPGRRSSGSIAAYPHCDIKAMRQPGKGKADAVFAALRCGARRRPDDPRCRSHHAAGATAEILAGDPVRQGRIRQRLASGLSDGGRGDAVPQSDRQQGLLVAVHLAAVAALHRHAVRHQGRCAAPTMHGSRPAAAISATSIRSAIST